jgi:uncharacterized membrane protein SpoIIM required for sporulation
MKVSDLLNARRANWRELEQLCGLLEGRSRVKAPPETVSRFSVLYRAACADLALADAYQLPPGVVQYLHRLVGRAHNQLYRSRTFRMDRWFRELFVAVPQRLYADNCVRLAFALFWGIFILSAVRAYTTPGYAERAVGKEMIAILEESFSSPPTGRDPLSGGGMAGFYIYNNAGIGLRCFAFGVLFGVGGMYVTVFNAAILGAVFGYMAKAPPPMNEHFYQFVTAHGPMELTAIVLAAGAGMRLGFALIDTKGYSRVASLRRAADVALPTVCVAVLMFLVAAGIEGFVSPSSAPYWVKAGIGVLSTVALLFYFVLLGQPRGNPES